MDPDVVNRLNSNYFLATNSLQEILNNGILPNEELKEILKLKNKLIIAEFLEQYKHFSKQDLVDINIYINANINNRNRLFVSDLIEFADDWNLELPYSKCIDLLTKFENNNTYVQLAMIDYLYNNLKIKYLDQIKCKLDDILSNSECNQSVQIKSAFFLFRITHNKKYLSDLIDLIVNGDDNKTLLKNILSKWYNMGDFFEYYTVLKSLL